MWVVLYLLVGWKQIPCPLQRPSIRLGGNVETTWTLPVRNVSEVQPRPFEIVDRDIRTMSATTAAVREKRWFPHRKHRVYFDWPLRTRCNISSKLSSNA